MRVFVQLKLEVDNRKHVKIILERSFLIVSGIITRSLK